MIDYSKRVLIVVDLSNLEYAIVNAAEVMWEKENKDLAESILNNVWKTDQKNLPNLLNYDSFRRLLKIKTQSKLDGLIWIAKNNHQVEMDMADDVDFIFTVDDKLTNHFRRLKYPDYKANRKAMKRRFDLFAARDYVRNVIFPELGVEDKLGYNIVKINDCESDDIVAVIMNRFKEYMCRILISSDHDFLQLTDVNQYNLWGEKITRHTKFLPEGEEMDVKDYLLWKIINGDVSDNIKHVFNKYGPKKSYNLVRDRETLKKMLTEDAEAANRFMLNRYLIDFRNIPKELEEKIYNIVLEKIENKFQIKDDNCMII